MEAVSQIPVHVRRDRTLRAKVIDACGMTCTFCHNEGTPVRADQRGVQRGLAYRAAGSSGRVSLYVPTNGVRFLPAAMRPDADISAALAAVRRALELDELHLTGGEPTLHNQLPDLIRVARAQDFVVAITSNGENGGKVLAKCAQAGLDRVNFSVFGTTPQELAQVQHRRFQSHKLAAGKLSALRESVGLCLALGVKASVNIVVPDYSHRGRVLRLLEEFGDGVTVRLLNSLGDGDASIRAILRILDELSAVAVARHVVAGVSGARTEYRLPDGRCIQFKEIRPVRLPVTCRSCRFNNERDCQEGYYGVRLYRDSAGRYLVGVCIQRMDLCQTVEDFVGSPLHHEILNLREDDYTALRARCSVDAKALQDYRR